MSPACSASRAWGDMVRCCWCVMQTVRHVVQCCWRAYTAPAKFHAIKVSPATHCCSAQHSCRSMMETDQDIAGIYRPLSNRLSSLCACFSGQTDAQFVAICRAITYTLSRQLSIVVHRQVHKGMCFSDQSAITCQGLLEYPWTLLKLWRLPAMQLA